MIRRCRDRNGRGRHEKLHELTICFETHNDMERAILLLRQKKINHEIQSITSYDYHVYDMSIQEEPCYDEC